MENLKGVEFLNYTGRPVRIKRKGGGITLKPLGNTKVVFTKAFLGKFNGHDVFTYIKPAIEGIPQELPGTVILLSREVIQRGIPVTSVKRRDLYMPLDIRGSYIGPNSGLVHINFFTEPINYDFFWTFPEEGKIISLSDHSVDIALKGRGFRTYSETFPVITGYSIKNIGGVDGIPLFRGYYFLRQPSQNDGEGKNYPKKKIAKTQLAMLLGYPKNTIYVASRITWHACPAPNVLSICHPGYNFGYEKNELALLAHPSLGWHMQNQKAAQAAMLMNQRCLPRLSFSLSLENNVIRLKRTLMDSGLGSMTVDVIEGEEIAVTASSLKGQWQAIYQFLIDQIARYGQNVELQLKLNFTLEGVKYIFSVKSLNGGGNFVLQDLTPPPAVLRKIIPLPMWKAILPSEYWKWFDRKESTQ